MKRIIYFLALLPLLAMTAACENDPDIETAEPQSNETVFAGTVNDFIRQQGGYKGYTFDSLLQVLNNVEGIADSLSQTRHDVTLFAVPDQSFTSAYNALNCYRSNMRLGGGVGLNDLLIEPFEIVDTVVNFNPVADSYDTTYVHHTYDYREGLRQLSGRYVFMQPIASADIINGEYKSLVSREMVIQATYEDASGLSAAGARHVQLIETRGSKQQATWVKAEVECPDIKCSNGYVHILSPRHEFGFNEITSYFANYGNEKNK